jgi:hypothetical protein
MSALLLRVLYENAQWKEKCLSPFTDPLCWKCQEERRDLDQGKITKLNITPPQIDDVDGKRCSGRCWEASLARYFEWGSDKHFRGLMAGMKVFLMFEEKNNNTKKIEYRIWGSTIVTHVNVQQLAHPDSSYRYWIRLKPFEPLPREKWSNPMSDRDILGTKWGQGFYRYIYDEAQVAILEKIVSGVTIEEAGIKPNLAQPAAKTKKLLLSTNIEEKVKEIADSQGRSRDDIIRQAVAEWLKKQE